MYLLDTNICIYFMKNTYPQLTERILSCPPSDFLISAITVFELEYGAQSSAAWIRHGISWRCSSPLFNYCRLLQKML